jgi:hypothetical protein
MPNAGDCDILVSQFFAAFRSPARAAFLLVRSCPASILHLRREIFPNGVDTPKPPPALLALSTQRAAVDQALRM